MDKTTAINIMTERIRALRRSIQLRQAELPQWTPLDEGEKSEIDALEMAINALERDLPKQPDTCPIYDGVCGYPIEFCSECPRHTKQEPTDDATLKDIFCTGCEYKEQEPCEDAVSRDAVIEALSEYVSLEEYEDNSHTFTVKPLIKRIVKLPSVTVRQTGEWIRGEVEVGACEIEYPWWKCSECGWEHALVIPRNYCPNCGAKMESEDKG